MDSQSDFFSVVFVILQVDASSFGLRLPESDF